MFGLLQALSNYTTIGETITTFQIAIDNDQSNERNSLNEIEIVRLMASGEWSIFLRSFIHFLIQVHHRIQHRKHNKWLTIKTKKWKILLLQRVLNWENSRLQRLNRMKRRFKKHRNELDQLYIFSWQYLPETFLFSVFCLDKVVLLRFPEIDLYFQLCFI